jgi:YggT family protein
MSTLISFVNWVFDIYILFVFVHILLSWFQLPYNVWLARIRGVLYDTVEPYLRLFRGIIPPIGMLDISPIIAIIVLLLARGVIIAVLQSFE